MKAFMDRDFLLTTPTAVKLYRELAETAPILDYHCHINPQDIYEDVHYENITQLWLGVGGTNFGDHYKWRLMRSFGVDEAYISGTAPDAERFQKWAECISMAIGNPLYHWSHLELKKYFGIHEPLTGKNAMEIYERCNRMLHEDPNLSVRGIILQSGVKLICTTDDPADSLEWHRLLAEDKSFPVQVLPAMRPDRAKNIETPDYLEYLAILGKAADMEIKSFADLKDSLCKRMDFFVSRGACVADHALEYVMYNPASDEEIEAIFAKRLAGEIPDETERLKFYTALMLFLGREYNRRGWVMQLHYGCKRNNNTMRFNTMGADTGFDCINNYAPSASLANFLNALATTNELPKTILYSLNPNDNQAIGTILGCFQDSSAVSKIQQGIAWWFNDHLQGMTEQMVSLANLGNLSGFLGMLTDSRSFLSYTRHDYFRRILCRVVGEWVEDGMYANDPELLEKIIKGICYNNAVRYCGFHLDPY